MSARHVNGRWLRRQLREHTHREGDCIIWDSARYAGGYGQMSHGRAAHRVAWELANGPIPKGLVVRHFVCNRPACVNVEHLRLGTRAENNRDKIECGRNWNGRGPKPPQLILQPADRWRPRRGTFEDRLNRLTRKRDRLSRELVEVEAALAALDAEKARP